MLISVYSRYLSPYGLHLSPRYSWFHLQKMLVDVFLVNRSICYCTSLMFYIRSLQPAITSSVWHVVPALKILLLSSCSGVRGKWQQIWWQQWPFYADIFHRSYPYVSITASRQKVPVCPRVPSQSRKGAVMVYSHPMMALEDKRPSPSHTERCSHRSTECRNEIVPQEYLFWQNFSENKQGRNTKTV